MYKTVYILTVLVLFARRQSPEETAGRGSPLTMSRNRASYVTVQRIISSRMSIKSIQFEFAEKQTPLSREPKLFINTGDTDKTVMLVSE